MVLKCDSDDDTDHMVFGSFIDIYCFWKLSALGKVSISFVTGEELL